MKKNENIHCVGGRHNIMWFGTSPCVRIEQRDVGDPAQQIQHQDRAPARSARSPRLRASTVRYVVDEVARETSPRACCRRRRPSWRRVSGQRRKRRLRKLVGSVSPGFGLSCQMHERLEADDLSSGRPVRSWIAQDPFEQRLVVLGRVGDAQRVVAPERVVAEAHRHAVDRQRRRRGCRPRCTDRRGGRRASRRRRRRSRRTAAPRARTATSPRRCAGT